MNNSIGRLCIFLPLFAASCGNAEAPKVAVPAAMPGKKVAAAVPVPIDVVCEMPYDTSWTDYTVYNNDTLRFCSGQCRSAFLARPGKYMKK